MFTLKLTHSNDTTSWMTSDSIWRIEEWLESLAAKGSADTIVAWEFV